MGRVGSCPYQNLWYSLFKNVMGMGRKLEILFTVKT